MFFQGVHFLALPDQNVVGYRAFISYRCTVNLNATVSTMVTSELASDESPRGVQGEDEECFGDH